MFRPGSQITNQLTIISQTLNTIGTRLIAMEASQAQTNQRLTTMEAAQGVTNQCLTSMEKAINNIEKTLHFQLRSVARSVNSSLRGGDQFIDLLLTDMGTFPMNNPTKLSDFPKMPLSEFKDALSSYGIPPKDAEDEES